VLVTRPDALQSLATVDTVVFDKTGTLTRGAVRLERCIPVGAAAEAECLAIAAALEDASEHPLARAFARFADGRRALDVRVTAGAGVEGVIDGRKYRVGAAQFVTALSGEAAGEAHGCGPVVVLGDERGALAQFELHDELRPYASQVGGALETLGVSAQILSGDTDTAVAAIAQSCGVREQFARRTPPQKLGHVRALQQQGRRVAMVGDGVNDAPVLAAADVSIAMGRGAALAQATADMVMVSEHLEALPQAIALARRTLRIARQNMIWAAAYNFGSLPLAALGYIPPWAAALGMSLSSVAVILNAMRLLPKRADRAPRSPLPTAYRLQPAAYRE
jgi:P-type Cu2+ transporter